MKSGEGRMVTNVAMTQTVRTTGSAATPVGCHALFQVSKLADEEYQRLPVVLHVH